MGGGRNNCSIPGCRTDRKKQKFESETKISLFSPPKNAELFEKWQKAIPFENFLLTHKDKVCKLHFREDELEYYYTTILADGTIHKIERGRVKLNPEAVPSVFNTSEGYEAKRKFPKESIPTQALENIVVISSTPTPIEATSSLSIPIEATSSLSLPIEATSSVSIPIEATSSVSIPIEATSSVSIQNEATSSVSTPIEATSSVSTPIEATSSVSTPIEATSSVSTPIEATSSVSTPIEATSSVSTPNAVDENMSGQDFSMISENLYSYTAKNTLCSFEDLLKELINVIIPNDLWGCIKTSSFILFSRFDEHYTLLKKVVIECNLNVKIFLVEQEVDLTESKKITCINDIILLLDVVENIKICAGATDKSMTNCSVYLNIKQFGPAKTWCNNCITRRKINKAKEKNKRTLLGSYTVQKKVLKSIKRKNKRLKSKVEILKDKILKCKKASSKIKEEAVEDAISNLPTSQKEAIRACLQAAKVKNSKGYRYTLQWVYECLLIKIKSPKTYKHLRKSKILALPSPQTLSKYIEKVRGVYGFQTSVFNCMRQKAANMHEKDRRGVLLLDEMKITSRVNFNRRALKVEGFTDLGDVTPGNLKKKKGDHVLVFMYQPFRGQWVQALACFLSKNAASGTILHHLIMECIMLLEKAGFFVDAVTCDGASWNRNMWAKFGIDEENVSCKHVCDPKRKLWFLSDFPHLIKNVRNAITEKKFLKTPDGIIAVNFWEAIVLEDNPLSYSLKYCPKLTRDHVHPKFYQKMNVAMAFQFFSHEVATAMNTLRPRIKELQGSEGCEAFIRRMNNLIDAMNSRCSKDALRNGSSAMEAIKDFLSYLDKWKHFKNQHNVNFLSESTFIGLKVTLKGTLELFEYLTKEHGYEFLMTSRLSQDSLERFFSMMRHACGCNDHPDGTTFLQLFRLLGTYSLIKPPRGSNVTGSDLVKSLFDFNDLSNATDVREDFNNRLELLLTTGSNTTIVVNSEDHSYYQQNSPESVVAYLAGFVAFKGQKMSKCDICKDSLLFSEEKENLNPNSHVLINAKSRGFLKKPSTELFNLISIVENSTMKILSAEGLQMNTLSNIVSDLEQVSNLPLIGCTDHQKTFTIALLNYYLMIRMTFMCRRENIIDNDKANKARKHKKLSKL